MIDPAVIFIMLAFACGLYVGLTVQDARERGKGNRND
jgi:hypothetical protein